MSMQDELDRIAEQKDKDLFKNPILPYSDLEQQKAFESAYPPGQPTPDFKAGAGNANQFYFGTPNDVVPSIGNALDRFVFGKAVENAPAAINEFVDKQAAERRPQFDSSGIPIDPNKPVVTTSIPSTVLGNPGERFNQGPSRPAPATGLNNPDINSVDFRRAETQQLDERAATMRQEEERQRKADLTTAIDQGITQMRRDISGSDNAADTAIRQNVLNYIEQNRGKVNAAGMPMITDETISGLLNNANQTNRLQYATTNTDTGRGLANGFGAPQTMPLSGDTSGGDKNMRRYNLDRAGVFPTVPLKDWLEQVKMGTDMRRASAVADVSDVQVRKDRQDQDLMDRLNASGEMTVIPVKMGGKIIGTRDPFGNVHYLSDNAIETINGGTGLPATYGGKPQTNVPTTAKMFASAEEATASGIPKGSIVLINGRRARID